MPKKIENPLTEGLPSKVYLKAFPAPKSRYQIAREIHNIPKGQIPPTAKVSNVVKDLLGETHGKRYLVETPDGIRSEVEPLVAEIEKRLDIQKVKLTESERAELFTFLNSDSFRKFVDQYKNKICDDGDVNAFHILTDILGSMIFYKNMLLDITDNKDFEDLMYITNTGEYSELIEDSRKIQLSNKLFEKLDIFVPEELLKIRRLNKTIEEVFTRAIYKTIERKLIEENERLEKEIELLKAEQNKTTA